MSLHDTFILWPHGLVQKDSLCSSSRYSAQTLESCACINNFQWSSLPQHADNLEGYENRSISCHLINSTDQNPSWEGSSRSAEEWLRRLLRNPKAHRRVYKSPPLVPTGESWIQSTYLNHISLRHILILSYNICLRFRSVLVPSSFPTKILYTFHISVMCIVVFDEAS